MTIRVEDRFQPGDIVGIALLRVNRQGEVIGSYIACKGTVKRVYRTSPRGQWRADIDWVNKVTAFVYTGKEGWAYVRQLTLVKRKSS